jgi:hypothetical protein
MGYGTRPHDWKTHELEPMKNSLSPPACVRAPRRSTFHNPSSPASMNAKQACRTRSTSLRTPATLLGTLHRQTPQSF